MGRGVVLAAVLLVSLWLAPLAHGQTADPDLSWVTDSRWQEVGNTFANPCQGFENALRRMGVSPLNAGPVTRIRMHHSWEIMLPVLAQVAQDDTLATDHDAALAAINEQVRNGNTYGASQAQQVLSSLRDWAGPVGRAWLDGQAVPPGHLLVALAVRHPELQRYWDMAAIGSGLPSAVQYVIWSARRPTTDELDTVTCGGYSQDCPPRRRDRSNSLGLSLTCG